MNQVIITMGDFYGDGHQQYKTLQFECSVGSNMLHQYILKVEKDRRFIGEYQERFISGEHKSFLLEKREEIIASYPEMLKHYANNLAFEHGDDYEAVLYVLLVYIKFKYLPYLEFRKICLLKHDIITGIGYGLHHS